MKMTLPPMAKVKRYVENYRTQTNNPDPQIRVVQDGPATAMLTGDGGEIVAWSDGATVVNGKLSERGEDRRGHGGFVETSGKKFL